MTTGNKEVLAEFAKAAPPSIVAGFTFFGHPLSEWAQLAAIVYSSLMIYFLLYDRLWPHVKKKFKTVKTKIQSLKQDI